MCKIKVLLITDSSALPQPTIDRLISANTETSDLALILANHHTEILCVGKDVQSRIRSQYKREIILKDIHSDFFDCMVLRISFRVDAASILEQFKLPPNPERRGKGPGRGHVEVATLEKREVSEPMEVSVTSMYDSRKSQHHRQILEEQGETA